MKTRLTIAHDMDTREGHMAIRVMPPQGWTGGLFANSLSLVL